MSKFKALKSGLRALADSFKSGSPIDVSPDIYQGALDESPTAIEQLSKAVGSPIPRSREDLAKLLGRVQPSRRGFLRGTGGALTAGRSPLKLLNETFKNLDTRLHLDPSELPDYLKSNLDVSINEMPLYETWNELEPDVPSMLVRDRWNWADEGTEFDEIIPTLRDILSDEGIGVTDDPEDLGTILRALDLADTEQHQDMLRDFSADSANRPDWLPPQEQRDMADDFYDPGDWSLLRQMDSIPGLGEKLGIGAKGDWSDYHRAQFAERYQPQIEDAATQQRIQDQLASKAAWQRGYDTSLAEEAAEQMPQGLLAAPQSPEQLYKLKARNPAPQAKHRLQGFMKPDRSLDESTPQLMRFGQRNNSKLVSGTTVGKFMRPPESLVTAEDYEKANYFTKFSRNKLEYLEEILGRTNHINRRQRSAKNIDNWRIFQDQLEFDDIDYPSMLSPKAKEQYDIFMKEMGPKYDPVVRPASRTMVKRMAERRPIPSADQTPQDKLQNFFASPGNILLRKQAIKAPFRATQDHHVPLSRSGQPRSKGWGDPNPLPVPQRLPEELGFSQKFWQIVDDRGDMDQAEWLATNEVKIYDLIQEATDNELIETLYGDGTVLELLQHIEKKFGGKRLPQ